MVPLIPRAVRLMYTLDAYRSGKMNSKESLLKTVFHIIIASFYDSE